jgi:hypothetical protein
MDLAHAAEVHAAETGLLRDRQLAEEALTYALAVARRSAEEGVRAEGAVTGRG